MSTHTPLPWKVDRFDQIIKNDPDAVISGDKGQHVTDFVKPADAELIVRAVNAHADLLASCKELKEALAGAMRVIVNHGDADTVTKFDMEMERLGIEPGIGVRAKAAIAKAEAV